MNAETNGDDPDYWAINADPKLHPAHNALGLIGIVSEEHGAIIAWANDRTHADRLCQLLNLASTHR